MHVHMQLVTVAEAPSAATGRKLLQSNPDGITSNLSSSGVTAGITVNTTQNVQVNLTVQVPYEDRNNVTGIVQSAINSGQVRRGLQEAGGPPSPVPHESCVCKCVHGSMRGLEQSRCQDCKW